MENGLVVLTALEDDCAATDEKLVLTVGARKSLSTRVIWWVLSAAVLPKRLGWQKLLF
jgi:hypothetical protein